MKVCANCRYWITKPTTGSTKGDAEMLALGYRNCSQDKSEYSYGRFLHAESSCEKYERKEK